MQSIVKKPLIALAEYDIISLKNNEIPLLIITVVPTITINKEAFSVVRGNFSNKWSYLHWKVKRVEKTK